MRCSNCGRENRAQAAFCDACGASLNAPLVHGEDGFVGRERELRSLSAALEQAIAGRTRVMMVSGEPGIGKTRTAQWFSHHAQQREVQVFWGRSHEEPGAPPYWAWLQIIRAYLDTRDDESIRRRLGKAASYIAEIAPEIAQRLPALPPLPPMSDAAQSAFSSFLMPFLDFGRASPPNDRWRSSSMICTGRILLRSSSWNSSSPGSLRAASSCSALIATSSSRERIHCPTHSGSSRAIPGSSACA
jgi:hypothetical protein